MSEIQVQTPSLLSRVKSFQELWAAVMPAGISIPPLTTFTTWLIRYDDKRLERAVVRTAEKMRRKITNGLPIGETDADRYCSSVARHLSAEQRRDGGAESNQIGGQREQ